MKPNLATRRARVARINAKRPRCVVVEVKRDPEPSAHEELLDILFELLEPLVNSGRK